MKSLIILLVKNFLNNNNTLLILLTGMVCMVSCRHKEAKETAPATFELSDTMMNRLAFTEARNESVKGQLKLAGKVVADENKLVEIYPLVGGNVTEVNVQLGDYVNKGDILAVIRSGEVADFERQLIDAKNDLMLAQNNQRVSEELFESKLIAEREVLAAKNEVHKTEAEIKRLNQIFSIYGIDSKSGYQVKSPISGFIIEKKINRDMQLRSDKTDNIFTVAEISDVWVLANVYETDISKIKEHMDAEVKTLSYPDTIFNGHVDKIYNILDPNTKTMKVRIRLNNTSYLLKPEMNATITLKYDEGYMKVAVPSSAVIFDKSKSFVMIFNNRKHIVTRQVETYRQVGETTYLLKGLEPGEKVISKNPLLIYDALND